MAPSRILIVRTSAMGDVVHTLPLATALRRRWPGARIGWVVERRFAPLLAEHPALDEVLEVQLREWRRRPFARASWRELASFVRELDRFGADVAIDAMGNHKGALIASLSRAERLLGPARSDRREPSSALWIGESVRLVGEHVVDCQRSLGAALGASGSDIDFGGEGILPASSAADVPGILIHPGAGWRNKEYPPARWGAVAHVLADVTGSDVGVLVGPAEEALAAEVVARSEGKAVPIPAVGLAELVAALRGCELLLAGDTGPLHLARALGTRVLCLLGPTDPARNGVWSSPQGNLFHRLPCSYCYRRLDEAKACLLAIEPSAIAARARLLLAEAA